MKAQLFSEKELKKVHDVSLCILNEVGVEVPHEEMLGKFKDSGEKVDFDKQRVFISPDMVEKTLQMVQKEYTLYGRDVSKTAGFGQGYRNYNSVAGEAYWVDNPGDSRRFCTIEDVVVASRLADALDQITIPGAMADPHEIDNSYRCVEVAATMVKNTTKPINFWYHDRASAKFLNELMIVIRGSKEDAIKYPLWYPFLEPISPLRFPFHGIDLLYETAELNLPVPIGPMAQMGISAPMSVAGTMASQNAEILAGICITQLIKPGMPVCYGGICHAFDMGTTQMIFGGPEQSIFGVGMTQLGKSYGLPVYINVGLSDSKRPDAQAGLEVGITLSMGAAAGADIFGHMGISGVDQATSLDMLVLQNEIIGYVESMIRPIDLSDAAFGLDVIKNVKATGESFIYQEHTAERFRSELWMPDILDREYYEQWHNAGAKDTEFACKIKKEKLLSEHQVEPVADDIAKAMDDVVKAARRELSGKK